MEREVEGCLCSPDSRLSSLPGRVGERDVGLSPLSVWKVTRAGKPRLREISQPNSHHRHCPLTPHSSCTPDEPKHTHTYTYCNTHTYKHTQTDVDPCKHMNESMFPCQPLQVSSCEDKYLNSRLLAEVDSVVTQSAEFQPDVITTRSLRAVYCNFVVNSNVISLQHSTGNQHNNRQDPNS